MEPTKAELTSRVLTGEELSILARKVPMLARLKPDELECLGRVELVEAPAGSVIYKQGETPVSFCILLDGEVRAVRLEMRGGETPLVTVHAGEIFGESPLLLGVEKAGVQVSAAANTTLLRIDTEGFWRLMATCPTLRQAVLAKAAQRIHSFSTMTLHQEKLMSLGTLAAGLMHELKNPGAAAKRSAALLRESLSRLQDTSICFCRSPLTTEQTECLLDMQREVLGRDKARPISTLEEADAEEELANWLEGIGVENAWKLAPTLIAAGWRSGDIACAQKAFPGETLQLALKWLEALISATQQLTTIEESLGRLNDLVIAVKKYAYEDKNGAHVIDVHESIHSTLIILGHKFRHKGLVIDKDFAGALPQLRTRGTGLTQVWTNLLDNAIDAAPEGSRVQVRTWREGQSIRVGIADEGPGIPPEVREHIFRPFFTTKPAGVGTGLGLGIAKRIVTQEFNGAISFTSEPGRTEFVVALPIESSESEAAPVSHRD